MFIDYDDIQLTTSTDLVFSFYGCPEQHSDLEKTLLDFKETDFSNKSFLNRLSKIEDLPQVKQDSNESKGYLSLDWIQKTNKSRPSLMILLYDARTKSSDLSWSEFENIICTDIHKVRKSDCYSFMTILIFIFTPSSSFTLESMIEEKEKYLSLKKQLDSKFIYYFTGIDVVKQQAKRLQNTICRLSIGYYQEEKRSLKLKKESFSSNDYVRIVNVLFKLYVITNIESNSYNSKYLEEILDLFFKSDLKRLGKNEYIETKAVACFAFRRICQFKKDYGYLVSLFQRYIAYFHRIDLYKVKSETDLEKLDFTNDPTYITELYWLAVEYDYFSNIINEFENSSNITIFTFHTSFSGYYKLRSAYFYNRILSILRENEFSEYVPKFEFKKLVQKKNFFIGRQQTLLLQVEPLNRKEIPYDSDLYLRLFCEKNGISSEKVFQKLIFVLGEAQNIYFKLLRSQPKSEKGVINYSSNMSFNYLILKFIKESNSNAKEMLIGIYRLCLLLKDLGKFKRLKINLIEEFNKNTDQPEIILNNLVELSMLRKLTQIEEGQIHQILENETIHQKFILNSNIETNSILSIDVCLKNPTPLILDLSEFIIRLSTQIDYVKVKKIKLFFNKPERNFTKDLDFTIHRNETKQIEYKIFVKENDRQLYLNNITIELTSKQGSLVIFDYFISSKSNNFLLIKNLNQNISKNAVNFSFDKNVFGFVSQYNVFKLRANKLSDQIKVEDIDFEFSIVYDNHHEKSNVIDSIPDGFSVLGHTNQSKLKTVKPKVVFKSFRTPTSNKSLNLINNQPSFLKIDYEKEGECDEDCPVPVTIHEISNDRKSSINSKDNGNGKKRSLSFTLNNSKLIEDENNEEQEKVDEEEKDNHVEDKETSKKNEYFTQNQEENLEKSSIYFQENVNLLKEPSIYTTIIDNSVLKKGEEKQNQSQSSYSVMTEGELSIEDYSFFWFKNNNTFVEGNSANIKMNLTKESNEIEFLVKFNKTGEYKMQIKTEYRISRESLEHDTLLINFKDEVYFNISEGFLLKQDVLPVQYTHKNSKKYFLFDTPTKFVFTIENKTNQVMSISEIGLMTRSQRVSFQSNVSNVVNKKNKLFLEFDDEIIVNSKIVCLRKLEKDNRDAKDMIMTDINEDNDKEFTESLGFIKIYWREPELDRFIMKNIDICESLDSINNESEVHISNVLFKNFDFQLSLQIEKSLFFNRPNKVLFVIKNITSDLKRVHLLVDNTNPSLLISGPKKRKFIVFPYQNYEVEYFFIPILYGSIRLPVFKVTSFSYKYDEKNVLFENKEYSTYYNPESCMSVREVY